MTDRLKSCGIAILLGALVSSPVACQGRDGGVRVAGWVADIDTIVERARLVHASPRRPAHSEQFALAAEQLKGRIADLADHRVAIEIQRLMALLGDGHSLLYPMPNSATTLRMLPVDVYLFADGLYIVGQHELTETLVGSRITHFGSLSTEEILARMAPYVSRDNDIGVRSFASMYLIIPEYVEAWGGTESVDHVVLTLEDTLGVERTVTLHAGDPRRPPRRLLPSTATVAPTPLYLRNVDRNFWIEHLPEHRAVYAQFNQVADAPDLSLQRAAEYLGQSITATQPQYLIVDVRHNNGGNNMLLGPLLDAIASFAAESESHHVYVVTSRSTFSAAQNFINRLERRVPNAAFAGEPSMSSPNFTGEDNPVPLPYSGMVVSISNRYWQDSDPDDQRPWIEPHLPVSMTGRDWLQNSDPVLERVLQDIRSRR